MFVRAQVISRGAGRSIVSAAAYRHRARMMDEQAGTSFSYRGGASELVHEELALPDQMPAWLQSAVDGRSVAKASEALWNAVDTFETRADAQLARELIIALPAASATTAAVPAMAAGMRRASVLPGSRLMSGSFIS